jgi:hypothetical protein
LTMQRERNNERVLPKLGTVAVYYPGLWVAAGLCQ